MSEVPRYILPGELPLEYAVEQPDRRTAIVEGGELVVYAQPHQREQTRRFLERLRAGQGLRLEVET